MKQAARRRDVLSTGRPCFDTVSQHSIYMELLLAAGVHVALVYELVMIMPDRRVQWSKNAQRQAFAKPSEAYLINDFLDGIESNWASCETPPCRHTVFLHMPTSLECLTRCRVASNGTIFRIGIHDLEWNSNRQSRGVLGIVRIDRHDVVNVHTYLPLPIRRPQSCGVICTLRAT